MDGRRNSTDLLTSIVAHQNGYRRVQQTQYTRSRSSYLGNRLIPRSSHLARKPGVVSSNLTGGTKMYSAKLLQHGVLTRFFLLIAVKVELWIRRYIGHVVKPERTMFLY
ncbi:hypothetical protein M0802_013304 [Mischocyttarus mexicanus]|nr:hypothetical protein M0802_013304 [Mischocyttarus mexicanus]